MAELALLKAAMSATLIHFPEDAPGTRSHLGLNSGSSGLVFKRRIGAVKLPRSTMSILFALIPLPTKSDGQAVVPQRFCCGVPESCGGGPMLNILNCASEKVPDLSGPPGHPSSIAESSKLSLFTPLQSGVPASLTPL